MIAQAAEGKPIVDAGCGSGRNAILLLRLGCTVLCMDRDLSAFRAGQSRWPLTSAPSPAGRLIPLTIDFLKDPWPLGTRSVGGIVSVHFFLPDLLDVFQDSLTPGGYFLLETVPGCGGNYLELPRAGTVRRALEENFEVELYKERMVGPHDYDAVTVRVLAKRR